MIASSNSSWSAVIVNLPDSVEGQNLEQLSVIERAVLIEAASRVLMSWPASLIDFAHATNLARWHLDGLHTGLPSWMSDIVQNQLARQNRLVTEMMISSTFDSLKREFGRPPTKAALRARLDWQGDRGLENHFPRREVATLTEWYEFVTATNLMITQLSKENRSRRAMLCDIAFLLLVLFGDDEEPLANATHWDVLNKWAIKIGGLEKFHGHFSRLLERLGPQLEELLKQESRISLALFPSKRQIGKRLRNLMQDLPLPLVRDIRVFRGVATLHGLA